jgi:hypothetical protein
MADSAMGSPRSFREITTTNLFVNLNARAGMSVFGGSASMAWNTFYCNSFDLELEDLPAGFFGPSDPPPIHPVS